MMPTRTDALRAALIALLNAAFPMLNLLNILHWTADQIGGVMLFLNAAITLVFLIFPSKDPTPVPPADKVV